MLALAAALAVLGSVTDACAPAVVEVSWARNPESDVAGYVVYRGDNPDTFAEFTDVGNATSAEFDVNGELAHYFAVQTYNSMGARSRLSSVVRFDPAAEVDELTLTRPDDYTGVK